MLNIITTTRNTPLIVFFALLIACSPYEEINETPSDILDYGSTPTEPGSHMPYSLDCSRVNTVSNGPSWHGITIGSSTYSDVIKQLAPAKIYWNAPYGHLVFLSNSYAPDPEDRWGLIQACFVDEMLSVLRVYPKDYPENLNEWVLELGRPDKVTWGYFPEERSLIWAEKGILAVINLEYYNETQRVFLFSPIAMEDLENSWLMKSLPPDQREFIPENPDFPPEKGVEDPWGYNTN